MLLGSVHKKNSYISSRVAVNEACEEQRNKILTPEAVSFLITLHERFQDERRRLLELRKQRQKNWDAGEKPDFLKETKVIREHNWQVAPAPADLSDRRVEITGPVDRKMMINALNSGAQVFMADFEDSLSPTWKNVLDGQVNCKDAVRRELFFEAPDGKNYRLKEDSLATLVVRPRGLHLEERNFLIDGQSISASLFDFGLYFFHNAKELIRRGSGPYFYLPKMESHLEARLWNNVFTFAQSALGVEHGTIRATCLIETITAAFEMDEILYELKDHASGLNAGRWDYIFSIIKKFRNHRDFLLPDRSQVTMTVPFMRAYTKLLVQTCHRRGAHAIGGMAAFIPNRKDLKITELAFAKVTADKNREAQDGFDGTWVAHPDLVPVAKKVFDQVLGQNPHQKNRELPQNQVTSGELLDTTISGSSITNEGFRENVFVALQYIDSWLRGVGAAAINNLMEDAATAEISRAELWQWIRYGAQLNDGTKITADLYQKVKNEELNRLLAIAPGRLVEAAELLDHLVLSEHFEEFLTIPAYTLLSCSEHSPP